MITKKQFTLLFCVFLFAVVAYQVQPVEALPFDNQYRHDIVAGDYEEYYAVLTAGEEISGYFETDYATDGLDFFVCDSGNFTDWDLGFSATRYEILTNMHTAGFSFSVPYDETWYIVFSNVDGSTTVGVDIAVDINADNSPLYSSSEYTYTGYAEVLEDNEYLYISASLIAGTVVDGHFSTFFTADGLDFYIFDETNFDDWVNGFSATGYSTETDMHQSPIDAFTIPTSGVWYCVFHAESEIDTLTFSYGIDVDTSNAGVGGGSFTLLSVVGLVAGLLILLILCCVCRSKKKDSYQPAAPPTVDHYISPPSTSTPTETIREREIVRDRVLVICPYCGSKNEQGITTCANCDAEL